MKAAASTQLAVMQISTSLPFDDCLSAPDSEKPSATASVTTAARARTRAIPAWERGISKHMDKFEVVG